MQSTFHIGQLVYLKERPYGLGGNRTYCIVNVLPPKNGNAPNYLIKNAIGAELMVGPQDIKAAPAQSLP